VTKVWRKSVNRYWRYCGNIKLPRESRTDGRTDALTHGRTHGRTTRKHIASAGAGGLINSSDNLPSFHSNNHTTHMMSAGGEGTGGQTPQETGGCQSTETKTEGKCSTSDDKLTSSATWRHHQHHHSVSTINTSCTDITHKCVNSFYIRKSQHY